MTITVAVKKNDKIAIGADSFWGSAYVSVDTPKEKLVEFNYDTDQYFVCAISGVGGLCDNLLEMRDSNVIWQVNCRSSARSFVAELLQRVKEDWKRGYSEEKNLENSAVLIATKTDIYEIACDLSLVSSKYLTGGAGCDLAMGAVASNYDYDFTAAQLVEIGLKTACQHSPYCKEPYFIIEL